MKVDMKLEVVVIPVPDVDRAKRFCGELGWRLDADFVVDDAFRVVQFTPPGSPCSIHFGKGLTSAAPGSASGLYRPGQPTLPGPHPERSSYSSFASFSDPDGSGWLFQEVTGRLPGRIDADRTTFVSAADLAKALRRAAAAHGEGEKRTGQGDEDWPDWYAEYRVREQSGEELPS
jgi:catechol 2,3-dioxygenase-like lactoylglutathione lyase family enzyme